MIAKNKKQPSNKANRGRAGGNPDIARHGVATQIKKGEVRNPHGPPRARTQLYRYICEYLEKTPVEIKNLDRQKLTLSQQGALKVAQDVGRGGWPQIRELLDRELGKVSQGIAIDGEVGLIAPEFAGMDDAELNAFLRKCVGQGHN